MNKVAESTAVGVSAAPTTIQVIYLRRSWLRIVLLALLFLATGGIFYLFHRWLISVRVWFYQKSDYEGATHVHASKGLLEPEIVRIKTKSAHRDSVIDKAVHERKDYRTFKYKYEIFYYEEEVGTFIPLIYSQETSFLEFHSLSSGISSKKKIKHRLRLFGESKITVKIPKIYETVIDTILKPFFVFQIGSIILWCFQAYYWYSIAIFVIMMVALIVNTYNLHSNYNEIKRLATFICPVTLLRFGEKVELSSENIVPGDIMFIKEDLTFPCDLVLLNGFCLVNETMLTGESQPIMKDPLPELQRIYNKDKLFTLSAGTKVVSTSEGSFGLVISTGYSTAKGELVRSILYPKPNRFNFDRDAYYFVLMMGVMTLIGFFIIIQPLEEAGYMPSDIVIALLNIVTIAVPPALPLTMSIGIAYSMGRLKDNKISCIQPPAIQSAGRVSVAVFDKTGTLTQDEMTLNTVFDSESCTEIINLSEASVHFQKCLAACHSLTLHNDTLIGDPQEIAIARSLGWTQNQLKNGRIEMVSPDGKISVSSSFTYHFTPELKRMGVVIESEGETLLFMKGAPEVIFPLCKDLPSDMYHQLLSYTRQGYRVLACAYKVLPEFKKEMKLQEIEEGLHLLGLPLLENPLKHDAKSTLKTLRKAEVRCLMSTGDNILTGCAVGKKLKMCRSKELYFGDYVGLEIVWENSEGERVEKLPELDSDFELIVSGNLLERIVTSNNELLPLIKERCKIFGRMAPKHKILLIEQFQEGDIMVAMIGDGANDCGALKQADVGLSLSEAEASIAAPFCTKELNEFIYVLREGRCSLASSYQCFRFMCLYSVLQFTNTVVLYWCQNSLTNNQYIYQDIFNVLPLTFTMGASKPYHILTNIMPPGALISVPIITSVIGQVFISVGIIIAGYEGLMLLPWYVGTTGQGINSPGPSAENDVVWMQASAQFIIMGYIFNIGKPFRESLLKNYGFCISVVCLLFLNIYLIFARNDFTEKFVDESYTPHMDYRWIIFGVMIGGAIISYSYDQLILPSLIRLINSWCFRKRIVA